MIFGVAELAVEKMLDSQLVKLIHSTSKRLIDVLVETSLLTQATFSETIPLRQLNLSQLLTEVVEEFSVRLDKTGMILEMDIPQDMLIHANPLIGEVFKNYISNAIKYARSGQRIRIHAESDKAAVSVSVSDFGDPILEHNRKPIFERHTQLEGREKRDSVWDWLSSNVLPQPMGSGLDGTQHPARESLFYEHPRLHPQVSIPRDHIAKSPSFTLPSAVGGVQLRWATFQTSTFSIQRQACH